jgi:hypothetical protein
MAYLKFVCLTVIDLQLLESRDSIVLSWKKMQHIIGLKKGDIII